MANKYYLTINSELYHHGIKGQKWGVRRYQTKDGGLTPAGRKRYGDDSPSRSSASTNGHGSVRKKSYKDVTVKDLQRGQRNSESAMRRAKDHVSKYGKTKYKNAKNKVTEKYKRIVQRQIENAAVRAALNLAVKGIKAGLPLLLALL